ncbi:MAG: hypothetical protein U9Q05_12990 [Thermodesulfobacteriota bacterium]|nr:hypothetical protein [Thermodesulfobacteriota bacterium]
MPLLDIEKRKKSFEQVELTLSPEAARAEALRKIAQLRAAEKIKSTILLVFLPVFRVTSLVTYNQYETSDAP